MLQQDFIEPRWINAFAEILSRCAIKPDEKLVILSETSSRQINIQLTYCALAQIGVEAVHLQVMTPPEANGPIIKSSGASQALNGNQLAIDALKSADVIIDLTMEGLMHAPDTAAILGSGARIMTISNEHPDILCRLLPTDDDKQAVKDAVLRCRSAKEMRVTSEAGTDLKIDMTGARTVGVWGWTDRPGTLAHWPGGLVVSFPAAGTVNGRLVMAPGDMNLTFKRYCESQIDMRIENDYVTAISGTGTDAKLMADYFASFGDKEAYATSHVGWGMNKNARYEALSMYDKAELNGTELRAVAGNFLYSTGANEFAGRFTKGHFDLPIMGCTISLDGEVVVEAGKII